MRRGLVALLAAAALAGAGCTQGPEPSRAGIEPPPSGTGYFVGAGADGLGASLDLLADDPVVRLVDAAFAARDGGRSVPAVGVASVVNDGPVGTPMPRFIADLATGRALPLREAADVLRPGEGPEARRALARLAALPARVGAEGAATAYVVLLAVPVAEVESVRMVVPRGPQITLAARRR